MNPFLKVMQLFAMMTATVLGMLALLLVTPDIEETMLRAVRKYQRIRHPDISIDQSLDIILERNVLDIAKEISEQTTTEVNGVEIDAARKSYSPWSQSTSCSKYRVYFARPQSLPMTALVSFPGSGNTWLRYLIETAAGVFTGSMYIDHRIISKGFYGEGVPADCGCTAVQKTHGFSLEGTVPRSMLQRTIEVRIFKGRAILLIRNPYEALISYRNFLYGGHVGFAPYNRFKGPEWQHFVTQLALVWRDLAATWLNSTRHHETLVLHFENVRLNPHKHLRSILAFLGISADEQRLQCVFHHADGPFHRPKSTQHLLFKTKDPFPAKLHRMLDSVIEDLNRLLAIKGWERLPTHLYKYFKGRTNNSPHFTM